MFDILLTWLPRHLLFLDVPLDAFPFATRGCSPLLLAAWIGPRRPSSWVWEGGLSLELFGLGGWLVPSAVLPHARIFMSVAACTALPIG